VKISGGAAIEAARGLRNLLGAVLVQAPAFGNLQLSARYKPSSVLKHSASAPIIGFDAAHGLSWIDKTKVGAHEIEAMYYL
jgi:hypothetical protein